MYVVTNNNPSDSSNSFSETLRIDGPFMTMTNQFSEPPKLDGPFQSVNDYGRIFHFHNCSNATFNFKR